MIEYTVLTDDEEIATVAASLVDSTDQVTTNSALIRHGDVHGVETLTIDLGGTMFVIAQ